MLVATAHIRSEDSSRVFAAVIDDTGLTTWVERDVLRDVVDLVADDEPAAAT